MQQQIEWREIGEEAAQWRARPVVNPELDDDNDDEAALHSVLSRLPSVSFLCITDTIITPTDAASLSRTRASASRLYHIANHAYKVPTNITDMPSFCDFAFPSTHRFKSADSDEPTSLQIGIVTNSKGCRLASRLTREVVARLPKGIGSAVDNIGRLRERAKTDENRPQGTETPYPSNHPADPPFESDREVLSLTPNEPVSQLPSRKSSRAAADDPEKLDETPLAHTQRRMRWVAQVSEYWPLESLASLDHNGIDDILSGGLESLPRVTMPEEHTSTRNTILPAPTRHVIPPLASPVPPKTRGRILLLGSGPGHPSLLTLATSTALQNADLVLSDKLVPEGVLRVIPKHVELRIARKFPGNADRAQEELMHVALEAARKGKVVVRLKQGDPMLYARASSEIGFFSAHGFPPTVFPGLSSALAAPLAAGIPVTARGVSESVAICTGVGKGGKGGRVPPYDRGTTVLVLMGIARLAEIVRGMMEDSYPEYLPTCIIERGTMLDQRVVRSTLGRMVEVMCDPRVGVQRPPGMMVVGWACLGVTQGVEGVSDDEGDGLRDRDLERVNKWLGEAHFVLKEGLDETWQSI
ncbi:hypothetical protein K439DRAFT_1629202 [Ramaria rubella]|nr:hypothetical protein K439DRAFT_1629202 [Ramaria rubella]